jgi:quercetin dioxygenase-like cupin family protein
VAAIPPSKDPKPTTANRLGYHRGNGVSHCLILDGELVFMVDTQETIVRAGDLIVERNTLHSWRNEGSQPVSMFIVTINAD